jgi:hypothetical protein
MSQLSKNRNIVSTKIINAVAVSLYTKILNRTWGPIARVVSLPWWLNPPRIPAVTPVCYSMSTVSAVLADNLPRTHVGPAEALFRSLSQVTVQQIEAWPLPGHREEGSTPSPKAGTGLGQLAAAPGILCQPSTSHKSSRQLLCTLQWWS